MAVLGKGKRKEEGPRVLDVTASMEGSMVFQEPVVLKISGQFNGTLQTRGELTIGDKAVVEADITGEEITIAGQAKGKIVARHSLRVIPPAVIAAEIWTPDLEVSSGARIEGTIHMSERGEWMSLKEVAAYLEVEGRVVEQWIQEGKLAGGKREAGQWKFDKEKIDDWVATQKSS